MDIYIFHIIINKIIMGLKALRLRQTLNVFVFLTDPKIPKCHEAMDRLRTFFMRST